MSNSPESELDLDLQFLPAWAQASPSANPYAKFEGRDNDRDARRSSRKPRGPRDRNPSQQRGPREQRPEQRRPDRGRQGQGGYRGPRENLPPLPEIAVSLIPEKTGVESLVRQIKLTGRAYPVFDIAQLILKKPDRYDVLLETIRKGDSVAQEMWTCDLDNTVWLSKSDAVKHILSRHFDTFYQTEKTPTDPPKGTYTFVAQCGMSGKILGPPNYHDYQSKLVQLHKERFPRMQFEVFKSRVKIVRDEEVVKKWVEEQSFKTTYVCLNMPDPLTLQSMEEVEKHFLETHAPVIVKSEDTVRLTQVADRERLPGPLKALVRKTIEDQRRFPLKLVTNLSQQFAGHSLQFFKVKKTLTHVSVARPRYLDMEATPVSDGVRKIVEVIRSTPNCTRRMLIEKLVPVTAEAAPEQSAGSESTAPAPESSEATDSNEGSEGKTEEKTPKPIVPTPEQAEVMTDLHWLIHQGHVIEFSTGLMEIAKKPVINNPPSEKKQKPHKQRGNEPRETKAEPVSQAVESAGPAPVEPAVEDQPSQEPASDAVKNTEPEGVDAKVEPGEPEASVPSTSEAGDPIEPSGEESENKQS